MIVLLVYFQGNIDLLDLEPTASEGRPRPVPSTSQFATFSARTLNSDEYTLPENQVPSKTGPSLPIETVDDLNDQTVNVPLVNVPLELSEQNRPILSLNLSLNHMFQKEIKCLKS